MCPAWLQTYGAFHPLFINERLSRSFTELSLDLCVRKDQSLSGSSGSPAPLLTFSYGFSTGIFGTGSIIRRSAHIVCAARIEGERRWTNRTLSLGKNLNRNG
jgi:hypothetical protein